MKITISVGGKFHAFHLARELEKRGYLARIFTSYPYFAIKREGVPKKKISCLILKEFCERISLRIAYLKRLSSIDYYMSSLFDLQVSGLIRPCDIFVGWSAFSLFTIRKIRQSFPAKVILERSSAHIEKQRDILLEESMRLGVKLSIPNKRIVGKELEEYRRSDYISVPSKFVKEAFLNKGFPEEKLIQAPLGVDTQAFRPIPKNDNKFRRICVGISVIKGIHYILQAINELKIKDLEVWLIGRVSDEIRCFLKKYSGNFKYLGGIPQRELYKYYSQGSVSILFSLEDGFGMVVLEAMACGLPVICSTNAGAKDAITEGIDGFIVPIRDTETLKEKITYLYQHPHICQEMGQQARLKVVSNLTWEDYGARISTAYLNLFK
jgi:glycosyltransferase involved in cell wall biosynthesis